MGGDSRDDRARRELNQRLEAEKREQRRLAEKERQKQRAESAARRSGLRGQRSLLSGGFVGFEEDSDKDKTTLGGN
jgi:hypothetical protein